MRSKAFSPKLERLLRRAVAEVIVEEELVELLESGRSLRLKLGLDPTRPDIHLGHAVALRKLRQLQELDHRVILIVGDWTAQIGDPSGQSATRTMMTSEVVRANAQTYMDQFFRLVDRNKTEVVWQSQWYDRFTLSDVIKLTSRFTVAQLLAREDFGRRYDSGSPIAITELLYPLLQGYDSVVVEADVEFGGTDQKFNILVGRELQAMVGQRPQQVFLVPILVGTDGVRRMSKTTGNYIGVTDPPNEMYGKVMSLPDHVIVDYFTLVTDVPDEEIAEMQARLAERSVNPMELKKRLAGEIVAEFHSAKAAQAAEREFTAVFQQGELPSEIPSAGLPAKWFQDAVFPADLLLKAGLATSRADARRLVGQGGVYLDGEKVGDAPLRLREGSVLRVGRRRFARLTSQG